jgi:hypothetical protein
MEISLGGRAPYTIADFEILDERSIRLKVMTKDLQWSDILLGDVNVTLTYTNLVVFDDEKEN